jgi:protein TonB
MSIGQRNSEMHGAAEVETPALSLAPVARSHALAVSPNVIGGTGDGGESTRRLFVAIFAVSVALHGALALRLRGEASGAPGLLRSKVEVELVRATPPPVVTPPKPPTEAVLPEPTPRVARPRPTERPAVAPPPQVSMTGIPEGDEGTLPPAPSADPQPILAAAPAPIVVAAPVSAPAPPPPVIAAKEGANYLKNPRPAYPRVAKREGWQGLVTLRVRVLPTGRPESVRVETSSGRSVLDDAAIEAIKGWTFVPATQAGQPVAGWVTVPIDFRLQ